MSAPKMGVFDNSFFIFPPFVLFHFTFYLFAMLLKCNGLDFDILAFLILSCAYL